MKAAIEERFRVNLGRVRNIVAVYSKVAGEGRGRMTVEEGDLLRAGVVLLHASLEDVLRSVSEWKLPAAPPEALKEVPLIGQGKKTNFNLGDLAASRGRTVDDVIAESVVAHLERSNYNNVGEVVALLGSIGLPASLLANHAADLEAMMKRRHLIAHRADRNLRRGRGHHQALSISRTLVTSWIDAVEKFVTALLSNL